ncbi:hypothetical protein HDV06_006183 [Boothiomyces sp. JEL0866]|nr:hypothetical protein HDV06_006183 [Boothiomyces sp. JEL0866]
MSTYSSSAILLNDQQFKDGIGYLLILVFGIAIFLGLQIYLDLGKYYLEKDRDPLDLVEAYRYSDKFVSNFHEFFRIFFTPTLSVRKYLQKPSKCWGIVFAVFFLFGIIFLLNGLSSIDSSNPSARKDYEIKWGLGMFFIGLIGYYLCRSYAFFKFQVEIRKKIQTSSSQIWFRYNRKITHVHPVFVKVKKTNFNIVKCIVLGFEFLQLISFPMRDLFNSESFVQSLQTNQGSSTRWVLNLVKGVVSIFSSGTSNNSLYTVIFVLSWWTSCAAVVIVLISCLVSYISGHFSTSYWKRIGKAVTGPWIIIFFPLIDVLYLVILNSLLSYLGCLADNTTPIWPSIFNSFQESSLLRIQECNSIHDLEPTSNALLGLFGFTSAFLLFTTCKIAQESHSEKGVITVTSKSELVFKTSSLILLILYSMFPKAEYSSTRGAIACVLFFLIVVYNIVIGSTYAIIVNYFRTVGFIMVFWTSAVVAYYTSPQNTDLLYSVGSGIWGTIFLGYLILIIMFSVGFMLFLYKWQSSFSAREPELPPKDQESSIPLENQLENSTLSTTGPELPYRPPVEMPEQPILPEQEVKTKLQGPRPMIWETPAFNFTPSQ